MTELEARKQIDDVLYKVVTSITLKEASNILHDLQCDLANRLGYYQVSKCRLTKLYRAPLPKNCDVE